MFAAEPSTQLANLTPLAQLRAGRLPERLVRLVTGLWLYGLSIALMIEGAVGAAPWDVFHVGASARAPFGFGVTMIATSAMVLVAWIPLRQMPGVGTIANALLIGPFAALNLGLVPAPAHFAIRLGFMAAGVAICAIATALYVGAQLGPGPRDGLMTGLARRTGWSIRSVRTALEVGVLATGIALGGTAGIGTAAFAFGIGPATQFFLRHLVVPLDLPITAREIRTPPTRHRGASGATRARGCTPPGRGRVG